jgi:hypothetical protein
MKDGDTACTPREFHFLAIDPGQINAISRIFLTNLRQNIWGIVAFQGDQGVITTMRRANFLASGA